VIHPTAATLQVEKRRPEMTNIEVHYCPV